LSDQGSGTGRLISMDRCQYNPMPDPQAHCTAVLFAHTVFPKQTSRLLRPRNPHNGPATDRPVPARGAGGRAYLPNAADSPSPHPLPTIVQKTGKRQTRRRLGAARPP
jgi:hypothetical protein